jgi:hypothetical protein
MMAGLPPDFSRDPGGEQEPRHAREQQYGFDDLAVTVAIR